MKFFRLAWFYIISHFSYVELVVHVPNVRLKMNWKFCQLGDKFEATLLEFYTICFLLVILVLGLGVVCYCLWICCTFCLSLMFLVVVFVFNVCVYVYVCLNMCPLCLLCLCLCEFVVVSMCVYMCVCSSKFVLSWSLVWVLYFLC
jgi:hypothetical protein